MFCLRQISYLLLPSEAIKQKCHFLLASGLTPGVMCQKWDELSHSKKGSWGIQSSLLIKGKEDFIPLSSLKGLLHNLLKLKPNSNSVL